jgi:pimeloyl-ACP methyl ester carboxylesterase
VLGPGGLDREDGWLTDELFRRNRRTQEIIFGITKEEKDPTVAEIRIRQEAEVFREIAATIKERAPESYKTMATNIAGAIEGQTNLFLSPWFRFYLAYDPRSSLMKVKCPVLAINGEKDTQVPPKENLEAIRQALEAGGNKDYTVRMLPNLNHLFQSSDTGAISEYEYIEETISPLALDTVSDWILQHTK